MVENLILSKDIFNEAYLPHLTSYENRINVFYGGAGSGKSHFVVQKIVLKFLNDSNRRGLVIRKVQNTIRTSIFQTFVDTLDDWKILGLCNVNKSSLEITLPNNSKFIFKGIDEPEKIKSIAGISDIVIEEASELNKNDYTQLNLRLRSKKKNNQIHLMFNPVSDKNWVYGMWFDKSLDNKRDLDSEPEETTTILKTTYKDNRFLPEDYIKTLEDMKYTNPEYYSIYVLGNFATLGETVYNNYKVVDFDYRDVLRKNKGITAHFGLDFGYTADPTAFVATLLDKDKKRIYIFDEFYERGLLNNEISKKISDSGYSKEVIIADSSEPKSIEEIKRSGVSRIVGAKKGKGSVMSGIQYIKQHEIYVHPSCENMISEFQNYVYKKDKEGNQINEPVDKNNHLQDALRYALSDMFGSKKIKMFDRKILGI